MTDNTQPEALMKLADDYAEASFDQGLHKRRLDDAPESARSVLAAAVCRQHTRIAELEAQLSAIGAGGVSGPLMGRTDSKEREAFERALMDLAAQHGETVSTSDLPRDASGAYDNGMTEFAWMLWQARASIAASAGSEPVAVGLSDPFDALRWGANVAETLLSIGRAIGFGRAQQILGEQWEAAHDCAPRGRMGVTVKDEVTCQMCGGKPYPGCNTEFQWEAACRFTHPSPPEGAAAEQALRKVLSVVQRYLPPDGPSIQDAMSEIIAIVDPWPLGPLEKP